MEIDAHSPGDDRLTGGAPTCAPGSASRPFSIRVIVDDEEGAVIGPACAALLEALRDTGSIAAAGRRVGVSYKYAWMTISKLNALALTPVVTGARGGVSGGGSTLTAAGARLLNAYRALEARAAEAGAEELAALRALLDAAPVPTQGPDPPVRPAGYSRGNNA